MLEFLLALLTTATVGALLVPLLRTRHRATARPTDPPVPGRGVEPVGPMNQLAAVIGGAAPGVSRSKVHEPAGRWPSAIANTRVKASICFVAHAHAWTQSSNRSAVRNSSKVSNAAARCRALSASGGGGGHSRTIAAA